MKSFLLFPFQVILTLIALIMSPFWKAYKMLTNKNKINKRKESEFRKVLTEEQSDRFMNFCFQVVFTTEMTKKALTNAKSIEEYNALYTEYENLYNKLRIEVNDIMLIREELGLTIPSIPLKPVHPKTNMDA